MSKRERIPTGIEDLETLVQSARCETIPQSRAVLWGECILHVLSLEDIREGLTFDELRTMNDEDASKYADHMCAVFEMRCSWRDGIPTNRANSNESYSNSVSTSNIEKTKASQSDQMPKQIKSTRHAWPSDVARAILTKSHFRCCVCPEHRRIADIHHIDGNCSNSVETNGVALCKECHADAHTISTMRRKLHKEHLLEFKKTWEKACERLTRSMTASGLSVKNFYYLNAHRLDSLVREIGEESILTHIPHCPPVQTGAYNTLWANPKNPLSWTALLENRNYLEERLIAAMKHVLSVDLNLFEVGAFEVGEHIGGLVSFESQFIGHDIPDKNELIESAGLITGPPPTMRREVIDPANERILETCMMLDSQYMYADSSFVHFSEIGVWSGVARITKLRNAVGSHDGHMLREQIILTPICIGTPAKVVRLSTALSGTCDPEQQYLHLIESRDLSES